MVGLVETRGVGTQALAMKRGLPDREINGDCGEKLRHSMFKCHIISDGRGMHRVVVEALLGLNV